MDAPRLRVGIVDYLNARPLELGLAQGLGGERLELIHAVPSALAERMRAGDLDLALLPVIELARTPDLEVVPGLGITTRGPSGSVKLVSRCPIERVESVALDPESRTSNVLAQVLLATAWRRRPDFTPGDLDLERSLAQADAAVRIGDKALFEPAPKGSFVYDLGTVWTEHTGLPFVFAAWISRPGVVDGVVYRMLHESRRRGMRALLAIAEDYAWNGVRRPEASYAYLRDNIHCRLGSSEIEAMRLFFRLAAEHGFIERAPTIRLALLHLTACHVAAGVAEQRRG